MNAIKVMYATNEITEIKRAIDELDPKKRRLILAIKPLDGKKGYAIKKYSNEFEIPRKEVVKKAKEAVIQIRENIQRIKIILTKEEKDLILEIADTFDGISKKIILLFFGINNENRRYSIDEISQILLVSKDNIGDILLEFLRLKNEILEDENKHQK